MVLILTTLPSKAAGRNLAKILLKGKLAACISISGPTESHYVWKGKKEKANEFLCWVKTRKSLSKKVHQAIKKNHPYEVPEIVTLSVKNAHPPYLKWVYEETRDKI